MQDINNFTDEKIKIIKSVAREHAIHNASNDRGMTIKITNNDIKEATGRERIKEAVNNKIIKNFKEAGMEITKSGSTFSVYCPPLLQDKKEYTLKELEERKSIIDDLNLIQAMKDY